MKTFLYYNNMPSFEEKIINLFTNFSENMNISMEQKKPRLIMEYTKLCEEYHKDQSKDLTNRLRIAEGKLNGVAKLKSKIVTLQETIDKMYDTLNFYLIQEGSRMAHDE
jgi:hypothetical protein